MAEPTTTITTPPPGNAAPGPGHAPGGDTAPDGKGGEAPKYLTVEEFNKAFSKRSDRLKKEILEGVTEGRLTKEDVAEMFAALKPPEPAKSKDKGQTDERFAALETQIQKLTEEKSEERKVRKRLEKEAVDKEALSALRSVLQSKGVSKSKANVLARELYGRKLVKTTADGFSFTFDDEDLGVEAGVAAWLGTDEGKEWAPAAPAGGSGASPAFPGLSTVRPKDGGPSEHDIAEAFRNLK